MLYLYELGELPKQYEKEISIEPQKEETTIVEQNQSAPEDDLPF